MSATIEPAIGDFLSLRGREWLVQDIDAAEHPHIVRLACVSDDAQGETAEIILDAEIGRRKSTLIPGARSARTARTARRFRGLPADAEMEERNGSRA
jgi:hypothetical protein